jgi:SAM-dependent methyltransferase
MSVNRSQPTFKSRSWQGLGLLLVSAAALTFQINLTRMFSVSQFYHFAFMAVSIALLGMGASGTFLATRTFKPGEVEEKIFPWLALGSGACMIAAYLLVNHLPFDAFSIFVDPLQVLILLLQYAALASPFFFSGMLVSMLLRTYSAASGEIYAVNLVGSALGCLLAVIAPGWLGAEGLVALSAAVASLAGFCFILGYPTGRKKSKNKSAVLMGAASAILGMASIALAAQIALGHIPNWFMLHISPYKSISYALQNPQAEVLSTRWNSISKIEVVSSPSLHSVPGLSYRYLEPLPRIDGLFVDGENLSAILPADADIAFADYLPAAAAFRLQPAAEVLILEPRSGMDILVALALGAGQVTAVEGNPLIVAASGEVYARPDVDWVPASGRSYLRDAQNRFDIIQLPLTDSYHPVGSGAYSLGEDYRYTLESFMDMINGLRPDGLLVVTRWLQETPSEWLRIFTLGVTALEELGQDPYTQIIATRGYNTGTILIKKTPFTQAEVDAVREFASQKAFDLVFAPSLDITELNRFNILPEPIYYQAFTNFLGANPRSDFYRAYPYAVQPPTDDRPFFSHYFKWSQLPEIISNLGITWQPFGGAGYLVILVILLLALLLSAVLILLPVALIKRGSPRPRDRRIPLYFGLIGLGFMLVEMPLIQRFILYLDQPAYALAAILFCILLFSGLGSRYGSRKLRLSQALMGLVSLLVLYILVLPRILHATLGFHLLIRLMVTVLLLAPLGYLMGIPFPAGLNWMRRSTGDTQGGTDRWMVAWIWAVNGVSSVLASILASLLALSFGFSLTLAIGMGCYALAWLASHR